ncbi:uncharacterized protein N7498_006364 [Penicillium cinerascens]|uniref:Uncharacterized protein n=1 Tax=Penicillium cinerascens TaxID=70096 RepID=A0A9W9MI36_9EURO|nr:uncharacterized protein N7498_006364 [Penicillium cinerascens]KAJ5201701.1 hypothetical protein N7498_006364 [Penicillium cinerascens]
MANEPGVLLEDSLETKQAPHLETAIPVFAVGAEVGITQTIRIETLNEFKTHMGSFNASQTLHVAVRSFFDNGGAFCYLIATSQWVSEIPKLKTVTLLVAAGQDILQPVSQLCQPGACLFALLDGPQGSLADENLAHYPSASHAAVYYPWLSAEWAGTAIPPSAVMAALYYKTDKERGVWSTPANIALQRDLSPLSSVTDEQQRQLLHINMIRNFRGRGTLVWGEEHWIKARPSFGISLPVVLSILSNETFGQFSAHSCPSLTHLGHGRVYARHSKII